MKGSLLKYLDWAYYIKLFSLFISLYYFNIFFLGLTDPKNYYNYFLDNYFNYIDWLRSSILYGASFITSVLGLKSYVEPPAVIKTLNGSNVILSFSCLGLGILSFWIAYAVANRGAWQRKLYWCSLVFLLIWIVNCFRIALLLIALENKWNGIFQLDHHTLFNILVYAILLVLMYLYSNEEKDNSFIVQRSTEIQVP